MKIKSQDNDIFPDNIFIATPGQMAEYFHKKHEEDLDNGFAFAAVINAGNKKFYYLLPITALVCLLNILVIKYMEQNGFLF